MWRRTCQGFAAITAILLLTAGSCNGSDSTAQTVESLIEQTQEQASTVPLPENNTDASDTTDDAGSNGGDAETAGAAGASGDFQTVFGIPPFGTARTQPGFGDYSEIDNGFQCGKNVFFELIGAERDQVVEYYTETLSEAGYVVTPLELGGSIALNLAVPDNPMINAVVQVGPLSPTDSTLGISQDWSEFKTNPDDDDDGGAPSSGSAADDSSDASLDASDESN